MLDFYKTHYTPENMTTIIIGDVMKPLAIKLRPKCIKDVIGQTHLIGKDKVLSNLVKNNNRYHFKMIN